ncbi:DMT family transporter [Oharaeibacter diazotrophicus]|uniref:Drug/metabolite transporter (DMT)-like permease n=1 Tax=Oharaeibacter diazotrophicus TaxID=1920512 RepID=A0A4R6RH30_9HYPH|nr:DMT family transporter [Oharaeibacter diazotrophicus]TDP85127.1 drug/metabolite transporter (DMT)-like permease [Oharaeibacter diazotrophicus]BBE74097.1 putative DMT superfamily transporter innermembrane protein [Pleomorphomonas sp. SM30]GLS76215.1 membrane protein [Oharaeibacter diazotrophicus]
MTLPPRLARRLYDNPYVVLAGASLFWAGNVIASRIAVGEVSPMALTALRWLGVMVLLPVIARGALRRDWPVLRHRLPYVALMGTLGFTAFNAFYYVAAHYTAAVNIGIIQGGIPGLVFVLAFLWRGTPARPAQVIGMVATLVGVAVLAAKGDLATLAGLDFNVGDVLMVGACVVYAVYTVLLPDRPAVAGLSFFAGLSIAAFVTSLPLLGAEIALGAFHAPSAIGWATVAYCAVFPSVLSQIFFVRGVELIGPGRAGVFVNLIPVFASVLAVVVLGEAFHAYHAAALALVLGGILFAERVGRPRAG